MPAPKSPPYTNEDIDAFEADFRINGYMSASMDIIVSDIKQRFEVLFSLSRDINQLAQRIYETTTHLLKGVSSHSPLGVAALIMPRALSAYQGAVMFAERGMHVESLMLTRSVYEAGFWIGYLHEKGDAAKNHLFAETLRQEIEIHKLSLSVPQMEDLEGLRSRMGELGTELKKYSNRTAEIKDIAKQASFGDRYAEYRLLCGLATHVNLRSIMQYISVLPDGTYNGHVIGPNTDEVPRAISFAMSGMLIPIEALRRITKLSNFDAEFETLIKRYSAEVTNAIIPADGV